MRTALSKALAARRALAACRPTPRRGRRSLPGPNRPVQGRFRGRAGEPDRPRGLRAGGAERVSERVDGIRIRARASDAALLSGTASPATAGTADDGRARHLRARGCPHRREMRRRTGAGLRRHHPAEARQAGDAAARSPIGRPRPGPDPSHPAPVPVDRCGSPVAPGGAGRGGAALGDVGPVLGRSAAPAVRHTAPPPSPPKASSRGPHGSATDPRKPQARAGLALRRARLRRGRSAGGRPQALVPGALVRRQPVMRHCPSASWARLYSAVQSTPYSSWIATDWITPASSVSRASPNTKLRWR